MLFDLDYNKLPDDLRDIIKETDLALSIMEECRKRMREGLRYHGLVPDDRITVVRVQNDGGKFVRFIKLEDKGRQNGRHNAKSRQLKWWRDCVDTPSRPALWGKRL